MTTKSIFIKSTRWGINVYEAVFHSSHNKNSQQYMKQNKNGMNKRNLWNKKHKQMPQ